jgi:protein TonB
MQFLVRSGEDVPRVAERAHPVEFVRLRPEPEQEPKRPRMPEPLPPLPLMPELDADVELDVQGPAAPTDSLRSLAEFDRGDGELELDLVGEPSALGGLGIGDLTPLVRVDPQYPAGALLHGIEGWVLVEFTVSATGSVTEAVVVDSEPEAIFDRAALQAVRRWRYSPHVVDGVPVSQPGVQVKLVFEIEE